MVKEIRIERALDWLATSLVANRTENPIPEAYWSSILPTVEIFGTQRAAEMLTGFGSELGAIEVSGNVCPPGRVRHFVSMEYGHDDGVNHLLTAGRIITDASGFPFIAFRDAVSVGAGESLAARNFTCGPGQFAAVRADAMGGAASLSIAVLFIEMPLGEYTTNVS